MTNERAIELLKRISDSQFDGPHGDERREALEMAVRALEPNLGNNGSICTKTGGNDEDRTTGDCISRQAAIEALAKVAREKFNLSDEFNHYLAGLMDGEYAIRRLPSAQPEILACGEGVLTQSVQDGSRLVQDCISRQQAIDLINARLSQPCKNHTSEFVQGMEDGYCRIRSDIKWMPSAQPELIEKVAYIRGFEQGRTQGMIDAQERKK